MAVKKRATKKAATKKRYTEFDAPEIKRKRTETVTERRGNVITTIKKDIIGATTAQLVAAYKKRLTESLGHFLTMKEFARTKTERARLSKKINEIKKRIKNL